MGLKLQEWLPDMSVDALTFGMYWCFSFIVTWRLIYHVYPGIHPLNARKNFHMLLWLFSLLRAGWSLCHLVLNGSETDSYNFFNRLQTLFSRFSLSMYFTALSFVLTHWLVVLTLNRAISTFHWINWVLSNLLQWLLIGILTFMMVFGNYDWREGAPVPYYISMIFMEVVFLYTIMYFFFAALLLSAKLSLRRDITRARLGKFMLVIHVTFGVCIFCFAVRFVVFLTFPLLVPGSHLPLIVWRILGYYLPELVPSLLLIFITRSRDLHSTDFVVDERESRAMERDAIEMESFLFTPLLDLEEKMDISRRSQKQELAGQRRLLSTRYIRPRRREGRRSRDPSIDGGDRLLDAVVPVKAAGGAGGGGSAGGAGYKQELTLEPDLAFSPVASSGSVGEQALVVRARPLHERRPVLERFVECAVKVEGLHGPKYPSIVVLLAPACEARQDLELDGTELWPPKPGVDPDDPGGEFIELGRTEVVEGDDPFFTVLLHYPHAFQEIILQLYGFENMDSPDLGDQVLMGQVALESRFLLDPSLYDPDDLPDLGTDGRSVTLTLPPSGLSISVSVVNLCLELWSGCGATATSYLFPKAQTRQAFHVLEDAEPGPFTWQLPYKYLCLTASVRLLEARAARDERVRFEAGGRQPPVVRRRSRGGAKGDAFLDVVDNFRTDSEARETGEWLRAIARKEEQSVRALNGMMELYQDYMGRIGHKVLPFRPSTERKNLMLAAVPVNLFVQRLIVEGEVYPILSMGAIAAHPLGFREGAGIRQIHQKIAFLERRRQQSIRLSRRIRELRTEARLRMWICVPQALTAVVTALYERLRWCMSEQYAEQLIAVGFLYYQECLLSTYGKERGMLGDQEVALTGMNNLVIRLRREEKTDTVELTTAGKLLVVELGLAAPLFDTLPACLQRNAEGDGDAQIVVWAFMFTQGINEKQTLSNTLGDSSLQDEINAKQLEVLQHYYSYYRVFLESSDRSSPSVTECDAEMRALHVLVQLSKRKEGKHVALLHKASEFVWMIGGARCTNCKSGKDRTAMATTLEQAHLLVHRHGLAPEEVPNVASAMRQSGVRRNIVWRNIGTDVYAFTKVQLHVLPDGYKAPRLTTKKSPT